MFIKVKMIMDKSNCVKDRYGYLIKFVAMSDNCLAMFQDASSDFLWPTAEIKI